MCYVDRWYGQVLVQKNYKLVLGGGVSFYTKCFSQRILIDYLYLSSYVLP